MQIYDGIFFITSALRVDGRLSIFSDEERYHQTIRTITSIQERMHNSRIYLVDASASPPKSDYLNDITKMGVQVVITGSVPEVAFYSSNANKTMGELASYQIFLDNFMHEIEEDGISAKRVYKVSGRYWLNDNFTPGFDYLNSFVFTKSEPSWMSLDWQKRSGIDRFYETRLYHMDWSLLSAYRQAVDEMKQICFDKLVNIEHAIYHAIHGKYNVIELDKIGLNGYIAPDGEYKDD